MVNHLTLIHDVQDSADCFYRVTKLLNIYRVELALFTNAIEALRVAISAQCALFLQAKLRAVILRQLDMGHGGILQAVARAMNFRPILNPRCLQGGQGPLLV